MKATRTIQGKITVYTALYLFFTIVVCELASAGALYRNMMAQANAYVQMEAQNNAQVVNGWLEEQSAIVTSVKSAIAYMNKKDKDYIVAYLAKALEENPSALMYYIAFGDIDEAWAANNEMLSAPPSERGWYQQAVAQQAQICTDPYKDITTGDMVISIAEPFEIQGVQCVLLADITIATLKDVVANIDVSEEIEAFLLTESGDVIAHANEEFLPTADSATNLAQALGVEVTEAARIRDYDGAKKLVATARVKHTGWIFGVTESEYVVTGQIINNLLFIIVLGLVLLCIVALLVSGSMKKSLKPMGAMKTFIKEKVIGTANCEAQKDEVEEISYLIREMEERFISVIRQTRQESGLIHARMKDADNKVTSINGNIVEISATMEETGANVDTQTESIRNIGAACEGAASSIDGLARDAQGMAARAKEVVERVDQIVPELIQGKENAIAAAQDSRTRLQAAIQETGVIEQITDVSTAIQGIASQTNLLALNASIEAARAGDVGRGFSVVAEEIKKLSEDTVKEISKVNELTAKVLHSVRTLSEESDRILAFIDGTVLRDYDRLEKLARDYKQDAEYYAQVSGGLGTGAGEISQSIQSINTILDEINAAQGELAKAVASVNENLQAITDSSENVSEETGGVLASIGVLQETMDKFQV